VSTFDVRFRFYVDDVGTTEYGIEEVAAELIAEAQRRPGWVVELEQVDTIEE
jgi:hypothetical protein